MRFSVIVPVYNREGYIGQSVDSVLAQGFPDGELIVVDDGSIDRTPEVVRAYGERLTYVRQKNSGPQAARRAGAALAKGDYLIFLDSDDILLPGSLSTYDRIIRACDPPALILGAMTYFRDDRPAVADLSGPSRIELVRYPDFLSKDRGLGMSFSKIILRRSVFERRDGPAAGGEDVFPMEDHDLLLRVGTEGPCILIIRPYTSAYRVHAGNYVNNLDAMVGGALALARAEKNGRYPGGRERRFFRSAYIGGKVRFWTWQALKSGRPDLAAELTRQGGLMMLAAAGQAFRRRTRPRTPPIYLSGPSTAGESRP
jgi:glycosyltransferase involved in cell wall biosynthesis